MDGILCYFHQKVQLSVCAILYLRDRRNERYSGIPPALYFFFEEKEIKELAPVTIGVNSDKKSRKAAPKTVKKNAVVARLQECGPRFTLKLQSLQSGTFDSKYGEYEWVHKPDMDTSRRRFFL